MFSFIKALFWKTWPAQEQATAGIEKKIGQGCQGYSGLLGVCVDWFDHFGLETAVFSGHGFLYYVRL